MVMLNLWLSYYKKYFADLIVYSFNTKKNTVPKLDKLARKYGMGYELLQEYHGDKIDGTPSVLLGFAIDRQVDFLQNHDWVLCCNLDEILIAKKGNLTDLMKRHKDELIALPSEGYDVVQAEDESQIDYLKPYFQQRKYMVKNVNYNKIVISRIPLRWTEGLHKLDTMTDEESRNIRNSGLYLIHLKHADLQREEGRAGPYKVHLDSNIMEHKPEERVLIPKYFKKLL